LSVHLLQEFAHCIELRAETFPISGLQPLDCPIVAIESLLRPVALLLSVPLYLFYIRSMEAAAERKRSQEAPPPTNSESAP